MTTIDRTEGFDRHWGLFETLTPLVQSTPGESREVKVGDAKVNIVTTRTWRIGANDIPVVSSSSIRAALRRALGYHLLEEIGVKRTAVKLSAAHLLLAGGALGTNMENDLTPEKIQEIRHYIPPLALLGGTAVGGFLHGRLMMGNWVAQTTFTPGPALILDQEGLPTRDEVLVMFLGCLQLGDRCAEEHAQYDVPTSFLSDCSQRIEVYQEGPLVLVAVRRDDAALRALGAGVFCFVGDLLDCLGVQPDVERPCRAGPQGREYPARPCHRHPGPVVGLLLPGAGQQGERLCAIRERN